MSYRVRRGATEENAGMIVILGAIATAAIGGVVWLIVAHIDLLFTWPGAG